MDEVSTAMPHSIQIIESPGLQKLTPVRQQGSSSTPDSSKSRVTPRVLETVRISLDSSRNSLHSFSGRSSRDRAGRTNNLPLAVQLKTATQQDLAERIHIQKVLYCFLMDRAVNSSSEEDVRDARALEMKIASNEAMLSDLKYGNGRLELSQSNDAAHIRHTFANTSASYISLSDSKSSEHISSAVPQGSQGLNTASSASAAGTADEDEDTNVPESQYDDIPIEGENVKGYGANQPATLQSHQAHGYAQLNALGQQQKGGLGQQQGGLGVSRQLSQAVELQLSCPPFPSRAPLSGFERSLTSEQWTFSSPTKDKGIAVREAPAAASKISRTGVFGCSAKDYGVHTHNILPTQHTNTHTHTQHITPRGLPSPLERPSSTYLTSYRYGPVQAEFVSPLQTNPEYLQKPNFSDKYDKLNPSKTGLEGSNVMNGCNRSGATTHQNTVFFEQDDCQSQRACPQPDPRLHTVPQPASSQDYDGQWNWGLFKW